MVGITTAPGPEGGPGYPDAGSIEVGFVPWSLPAAAGLVAGIALSHLHLPWWVLLLAVSSTVLALRRQVRHISSWLPIALVCLPLGYLRYALWQAQPNPVAELVGRTLTLSGRSDGTVLTLDDPAGARLALAPRAAAPPGRVTLRGEVVEAPGKRNPGGFDYRGYLRRRGVWGQLFVAEVLASTPRPDLRARFARGVVHGLTERPAALMQAMTLGVRDDLGELRDAFARAGLAHVLALSGLHVGVLMAALGRLLAGLGLARYPLMLALLLGFVLLVGASPSVVRAGVMVAAVLLALWLGVGRLEPWPLLALAALAGLLWNPSWLFDLSFQLSYLAVAGMLVFSGPIVTRFSGGVAGRPWWHWRTLLLAAAVTSGAAQALSLPLVADAFGRVPLLSPLINIVAVPLAGLLIPLGFAASLLGLLWLPLAAVVNVVAGPLAALLIALAELGAAWPSLAWGEIAPIGYLHYGVGVTALALAVHRRLRPWRGLLLLASAVLASWLHAPAQPSAEIVFLDVGQGDSALIRLPGRIEILVDGGGTPFSDFDTGAETVVPALRALGVDELELVIASHADTDHIEGLTAVLEAFPVQLLAIGMPAWDKGVFRELMAAAERRGVPVWELRRGENLHLAGASLDILNPPQRPFAAVNDNSVAFVLRYGGRAQALFLGDLAAAVEAQLALPPVEVLMVAHHGSLSSTSPALVEAARPRVAVISVGRNSFGHPTPEVIGRLQHAGVRVLTTREAGAVRLPLGRP